MKGGAPLLLLLVTLLFWGCSWGCKLEGTWHMRRSTLYYGVDVSLTFRPNSTYVAQVG